MLKVISFDVGETLIDGYYLDYVWDHVIPQLYAQKTDVGFPEAQAFVLREYDKVGKEDLRWYLPEYWFTHFHLEEDPLDIFRLHRNKIRFYPEVSSVLESLSQNYELIVASGIPRNILEVILKDRMHRFQHVFSVVTQLHEVKKIPKFYELICNILRIKPETMVHIGDDWYSDFTSPRTVGIQSFIVDRTRVKKGKYVINDLQELEYRLRTENK